MRSLAASGTSARTHTHRAVRDGSTSGSSEDLFPRVVTGIIHGVLP